MTSLHGDPALEGSPLPKVCQDPRFRAGRMLVRQGEAEKAVTVFANLLAEARRVHDDTIETAPAYYEYGNALFRLAQHATSAAAAVATEDKATTGTAADDGDAKPSAREAAARAAEARQLQEKPDHSGTSNATDAASAASAADDDAKASTTDDDDAQLALEMMETAFALVDANLATADGSISADTKKYLDWCQVQLPRILTGLGDVLVHLQRGPDAVDAYCRALSFRQSTVEGVVALPEQPSLQYLSHRRRLVEANVLVAETLLDSCAPGHDVVTTESEEVLVPAADRVEVAQGYYQAARDALQETVLLLGELVATGQAVASSTDQEEVAALLDQEKEDVCFASTLVMAVGVRLAEEEERAAPVAPTSDSVEPTKKKAKRK